MFYRDSVQLKGFSCLPKVFRQAVFFRARPERAKGAARASSSETEDEGGSEAGGEWARK
jgi:hypothetical protein